MDSVFQSLLWKEWQERKRTLFVCLAWILFGLIYVVIYESVTGFRTPVARFGSVCMVYGLFMTVFLAMRVCLSEVTYRTLPFSTALPVSLPKIATVRLGFAIFSLVVPILFGAMILTILLVCGVIEQVPALTEGVPLGIEIEKLPSLSANAAVILLVKITSIAVVQSMALFLILCVFGVRQRREIHIGFFGAAISFIWVIPGEARIMLQTSGFTSLQDWIGALFPQSMAIFYGYADVNGTYSHIDLPNQIWIPLFLNLVIVSGLGFWFTRRYGKRTGFVSHKRRRWKRLPLFSWISVAHRFQTSSLIWINLRQSVPLALPGLALASGLVIANLLNQSNSDRSIMEMMAYNLPSGMWVAAILWATVVGSGIFAAELAPNLRHFWMSRPISIKRWFWFKYLVGFFVVLLVLDGTTIAVSWNSIYKVSSRSPHFSRDVLSWSYIACFPILHSMMYSLAVLGVCWWKKPVRGAVFAIAVFFIGSIIIDSIPAIAQYDPIDVYNNLIRAEREEKLNLAHHHFPLVFSIVGMITFCTAFLASRKVQRFEF